MSDIFGRTKPLNAGRHPVSFRRFLLTTALSIALLAGAVGGANAKVPPCKVSICPTVGATMWTTYTVTVVQTFELVFIRSFIQYMSALVEAMTLHANQKSNNASHEQVVKTIRSDREAAVIEASSTAYQRTNVVKQVKPSETACATGSYTKHATYGSYAQDGARDAIAAGEKDVNNRLSNVGTDYSGGGIGTKGQLNYLSQRYEERMSRYNNPDMTQISGVGSYGKDADLKPFASLLEPILLDDGKEYDTARDVVYNLAGDVVLDPVRGPLLDRQSGKNLAVVRYSWQAKLNLIASVMMGAVERRREHAGMRSNQSVEVGSSFTTYNTLEGKDLKDISTSSYAKLATAALVEGMAGQTKGQNLDQAGSLMMDTGRQLLTLYTIMEQWTAIKAVNLVLDIEESRVQPASMATRPME